jgi:hypothetical protein
MENVEQTHHLLARNIDRIDLRFADRIVLHQIATAAPPPDKPGKKQLHAQTKPRSDRETANRRTGQTAISPARLIERAGNLRTAPTASREAGAA